MQMTVKMSSGEYNDSEHDPVVMQMNYGLLTRSYSRFRILFLEEQFATESIFYPCLCRRLFL